MNEHQFAERVAVALDEAAEHLPYKVTHRLQAARQAALSRLPELQPEFATEGARAALALGAREVGHGPRRGRVLATAIVSLLVLAAGLTAISVWSELEAADENADLDMEVLADDDVPISAYADRGFGVFIKNWNQ